MIKSRLRTYAITATGSATLVAGGVTNAEIISGGPVNIQPARTDGDTLFTVGGQKFKAFYFTGGGYPGRFSSVGLNMAGGALGVGYASEGSTISVGASFSRSYPTNFMYWVRSTMTSTMTTQYTNGMPIGTSVLLGFSISDTDDTFYGWINYSLSIFQSTYTFTINSWAYNDVANEGIIAGQYQAAGSSAVPGLGGLAALAIGAAGVRSRRQRTVA